MAYINYLNISICLLMIVCVHVRVQLLIYSVVIVSHESVYVKKVDSSFCVFLLPLVLFTMATTVWTVVSFVLICCRNTLVPLGCVSAALLAVSRLSLFFNF
jgi:hypothetical protein